MSNYNSFSRTNATHEEWKIVDKFDSAYWSGLDVQVYADKFYINEAIQVNYVISEQIRPYYGYSSHVAQRIHHGARIIQGELSLNFKRDGYLFSLLNKISQQTSVLSRNTGPSPEVRQPIEASNTPYGPDVWEELKTTGLSPEIAAQISSKYTDSREAAINSISPGINLRKGIFETKLEGFDINIVFGANLSAARTLKWLDGEDYRNDPLDNQYSEGAVMQEQQGIAAYSGIKLIGVSIGGLAKTVNDDGRPLIETYSFQAKDIIILHSTNTFSNPNIPSEFNGDLSGDPSTDSKTLDLPSERKPGLPYANGQIGTNIERDEFFESNNF